MRKAGEHESIMKNLVHATSINKNTRIFYIPRLMVVAFGMSLLSPWILLRVGQYLNLGLSLRQQLRVE